MVKHEDNIKLLDGRMESRSNTFVLEKGEKAATVKHSDNLKLEGSMSLQRSGSFATRGERHNVVKRSDNLKMEGEFEGKRLDSATTSRRVSNASTVSHRSQTRDRSNIIMGDDVSAATTSKGSKSVTSKSKTTMSKQELQSAQVTTEASAAARANASSAFQSALVQNGQSSGNISAINTDKFASSLRESSANASQHQQKEISVIEHHRKQSLQKQQRSDWGAASSSAGYDLNAHTGRTAAYGGRDYEQAAALVGAGRRSEVSRDYSAKSSGFSYNAQDIGSSTRISSSSTSRQAAGAVISGASFSQQSTGAVISGSSLRQHAAGAVLSGGGSLRQQSSGAVISGSSLRQHAAGAVLSGRQEMSLSSSAKQDYQSMYQSTSQQSFRGQQVTYTSLFL